MSRLWLLLQSALGCVLPDFIAFIKRWFYKNVVELVSCLFVWAFPCK